MGQSVGYDGAVDLRHDARRRRDRSEKDKSLEKLRDDHRRNVRHSVLEHLRGQFDRHGNEQEGNVSHQGTDHDGGGGASRQRERAAKAHSVVADRYRGKNQPRSETKVRRCETSQNHDGSGDDFAYVARNEASRDRSYDQSWKG